VCSRYWKIRAGWWLTYPSEKYEFVKWDDDIPNILWKNKKCSKPPSSIAKLEGIGSLVI
jgi:hypothetical protein